MVGWFGNRADSKGVLGFDHTYLTFGSRLGGMWDGWGAPGARRVRRDKHVVTGHCLKYLRPDLKLTYLLS